MGRTYVNVVALDPSNNRASCIFAVDVNQESMLFLSTTCPIPSEITFILHLVWASPSHHCAPRALPGSVIIATEEPSWLILYTLFI